MVKAQCAKMLPLKLELDAKTFWQEMCQYIFIYIYIYIYIMLYSNENNFIKFSRLNSNSNEWIVQNTMKVCIRIYFSVCSPQMLLHIILIYWLLHHYVIEVFPIEDLVLPLSQNKKIKIKMQVLYDINVICLLSAKKCEMSSSQSLTNCLR